MAGPVFIEGDRVNLRTIEEDDAEFMRDVKNLPEMREGITIRFPISREHEENFYQDVVVENDDESVRLMVTRDDERIGMVELLPEDEYSGSGEIAIWIKPEAQGNGYATEASALMIDHAFSEMRYHKIIAYALESNPESQNIWEKLGFTQEGLRRAEIYTNDEYQDLIVYGLLEHEWESPEI